MKFIYRFIYFIVLISFLMNSYPYSDGIILRNMEIKKNIYYEKTTQPREALEILLEEDKIKDFPKEVSFFTIKNEGALDKHIFDCQKKIQSIRSEYESLNAKGEINENNQEKGFASFWKKKLRLCYLKYKKSSPTLYYEFQHLNEEKYILDSIIVTVHFIANNMSAKGKYFNNDAELGKETIIIDTHKTGRQVFATDKTYVIQKALFGLELRLFTEEYWSGRFEKSRSLLDIDFMFSKVSSNEKILVNGNPFMIDL